MLDQDRQFVVSSETMELQLSWRLATPCEDLLWKNQARQELVIPCPRHTQNIIFV